MKNFKKLLLLNITILFLFHLSACNFVTTKTDKAEEYIYRLNEEIKVYDADNNGALCALKITNAKAIIQNPVTVKTETGVTSSGETIYRKDTYSYFLQITFQYTNLTNSSKHVYYSDFSIKDAKNIEGKPNPDSDENGYITVGSKESKEKKIIFGFQNPVSSPTLVYSYAVFPTAKIKLNVSSTASSPISSTASSPISSTASSSVSSTVSKSAVSSTQSILEKYESTTTETDNLSISTQKEQGQLICLLVIVISILIIVIIFLIGIIFLYLKK